MAQQYDAASIASTISPDINSSTVTLTSDQVTKPENGLKKSGGIVHSILKALMPQAQSSHNNSSSSSSNLSSASQFSKAASKNGWASSSAAKPSLGS